MWEGYVECSVLFPSLFKLDLCLWSHLESKISSIPFPKKIYEIYRKRVRLKHSKHVGQSFQKYLYYWNEGQLIFKCPM